LRECAAECEQRGGVGRKVLHQAVERDFQEAEIAICTCALMECDSSSCALRQRAGFRFGPHDAGRFTALRERAAEILRVEQDGLALAGTGILRHETATDPMAMLKAG
jgi:hypothetical protein